MRLKLTTKAERALLAVLFSGYLGLIGYGIYILAMALPVWVGV